MPSRHGARPLLIPSTGIAVFLVMSVASSAGVASPIAVASPTTENASAAVSWSPERPRQGVLFTVQVTPTDGEIASVEGRAGQEPLHFWPEDDGTFRSLAPIPVATEGSLPLTVTVRYADGGEDSASHDVPVSPGAFRHERLTVAPEFGAPLDSARQARLDQDRAKAARVSREARATPRLWTSQALLPRDDRVTSGFGNGREFNGQISSRHMGLDLDGNRGDTVVAATRGVVALVDEFLLAGNIVYLNHGGGLLSGYFHLSEQLVSEGDTVEAGTPIGLVGATGRVTGPHLHWVVRYGTTSVDPQSMLEVTGR